MTNVIYAEFKGYPKTPRLNRDIVITEKIDGTNAAIQIIDTTDAFMAPAGVTTTVGKYAVVAQSRKRIITPGKATDNQGFAAWVWENAEALVAALGEGTHYGEWYGQGIQGNHQRIEGKRFALFNTHRWWDFDFDQFDLPDVECVPVLYSGPFDQSVIDATVRDLRENGSLIGGATGTKAEGVIVYHTAAGQVFKVLCENDELPKGVTTWQERQNAAALAA